jgi:WXG100 family type VII secretion target
MSSDFTYASFGGMATGEQQFLAAFNALTSTLSDLQRQLENSLQAWTGDARAAYTQAKAAWDNAAQDMATVLNHLGTVIGTANTTYQSTERALSSLWA